MLLNQYHWVLFLWFFNILNKATIKPLKTIFNT